MTSLNKRLNPETGKVFKSGFVREDGLIFRSYINNQKGLPGFCYEIWEDEKTFYRRQTERKLNARRNHTIPKSRAKHMLRNCKKSAKERKIEFNLKLEDILPTVESGRCQLTGMPFDFHPHKDKNMNPYAPSVDRINNDKGYVSGNVRVVLWLVNSALGECSDEEALPILKALVKALDKNVKKNTTAPVPKRVDQQGEDHPQLGFVFTTGLGEDDDNAHHHCGTISRQDLDHRAQEGSGDSVGQRGQEVGASQSFTRVENHGEPDAEIVRLDFSSRHLFD